MKSRLTRYPFLSACCLVALAVLIGLSVWQVQRLAWKNALIARIAEESAAPPLELSNGALKANLPEFRRVMLKGTFLPEKTLLHQARYYKGNLGFHLITPLRLVGGEVILVNRGWVPKDFKTNPKAAPEIPKGPVTLVGIVRKSEKSPYSFLPQNDPEKGFWLWQDVEGWAKEAGTLPILVQEVSPGQDVTFPIVLEAKFEITNDHLQYALTWAALSLILAVMWWVYTGKKR